MGQNNLPAWFAARAWWCGGGTGGDGSGVGLWALQCPQHIQAWQGLEVCVYPTQK